MFASLFAAHAARAQAVDAHLSLPGFVLPDVSLPSVTLVSANVPAIDLPPVTPPSVTLSPVALPDDPSAALAPTTMEGEQAASPAQAQPGQSPSGQSQPSQPSSADSSTKPAQDTKSAQTADEQLKEQEHQRVLGVMAAFNTTSNHDALPLTSSQKFKLFFKSETDPWPFLLASVIAGIGQADDSFPEYGQGMQGYGKRIGAAYTDAFIGNFFGNAVLTSLLHEDPRYYQKGTGSVTSRVLWAATSTVWCKRDNGGWGPNYANVAGNLIGAAISNVYYPASDRTVSDTITRGLTVSAEGIIGSEVIEFWPDIARHFSKKRAKALQKSQQDAQAAQAAGSPSPAPAPPPAGNPPKQ
jgi:hypothetical protein